MMHWDSDPLHVDEEPWYPSVDELDAAVVGSAVLAYALLTVAAALVAVLALIGLRSVVTRSAS